MAGNNLLIGGFEITPVEFELIPMLIKNMKRQEMAAARHRSLSTVNGALRHLFSTLHVKKNIAVVEWALKHGWNSKGVYHAIKQKAVRVKGISLKEFEEYKARMAAEMKRLLRKARRQKRKT